MYKIKINKTDFKKLKKLPHLVEEDYKNALKRVLLKVAEYTIAEAKKNTTVGVYEPYKGRNGELIKTGMVGGTLRNAWTRTEVFETKNTYRVDVFNPIEYAQYYEYGHRQTPGRYVPQIGKRLKAQFVKGRFPLNKAITSAEGVISKIINHEIEKAGNV